ncbi:MAG: BspA family leucine-rich repeat surface protein [Gilvibacter sp.]
MKAFIHLITLLCLSTPNLWAQDFITVWKSDNPGSSLDSQITIPTSGDAYDYNVDWGDGSISTNVTGNITHTYAIPGTYTVSISGAFPQIYFNNQGDKLKLIEVSQWGAIAWRSMEKAFFGCQNMEVSATDAPDLSMVTSLVSMFKKTKATLAHIGNWDTSNITTMNGMFLNAKDFNTDISSWDVSKVKNISAMFKGAVLFNQPLNNWDIGKVSAMNSTFENAAGFNQSLSNWDVSAVKNAKKTFKNATNFNQDLSNWDVSVVKNMTDILVGTSLDCTNYDRILLAWSQLALQDNVTFSTNANYCISEDARTTMVTDFGWTITDGGINILPVKKVVVPLDQTQLADPITGSYSLPDYITAGDAYALESCTDTTTSVVPVQDPVAGTALGEGEHLISFTAMFPSGETVVASFLLTVDYNFTVPSDQDFVTVWDTNLAGTSYVKIPTLGDGYDFDIDWGDGTIEYGITGTTNHNYGVDGIYVVRIRGDFPRLYFKDESSNTQRKIAEIRQWGGIRWESLEEAFYNCPNVRITATDAPDLSLVTSLSYMFYNADSVNESLSSWDVSTITDMSYMFANTSVFNGQLAGWDTSNVTTMEQMFYNADAFNRPIDTWDVSSVTNMESMFERADYFNKPLDNWDVSNVVIMSNMFEWAIRFNQPIGSWDVSNVTKMDNLFNRAEKFNQPIGDWDVSNVTNMWGMFAEAERFDQPIGAWDVSNVTTMNSMFSNAHDFNQPIGAWDMSSVTNIARMFRSNNWDNSAFNQPIDAWDVSNVTSLERLFEYSNTFNQPLNSWDVSNVTSFYETFKETEVFDQPLDNWDTSSATTMRGMFEAAIKFNQPVENWDVSSVTKMEAMFCDTEHFNQPIEGWDVSNVTNMRYMFARAVLFNQPLNGWDVSNVTDMYQMFRQWFTLPISFDQPLDQWDVSNVTIMSGMFAHSNMSTEHYDGILRAWSLLDLQTGVGFDAGETYYCEGESARNYIISTFGWEIKDLGLATGCGLPEASSSYSLKTIDTHNGLDDIAVYPIPSSDEVHIKINAKSPLKSIRIYDLLGRLVRTKSFSPAQHTVVTVPILELDSGSYVMRLTLDNAQEVVKTFIKM